jgi:hypothetical protein
MSPRQVEREALLRRVQDPLEVLRRELDATGADIEDPVFVWRGDPAAMLETLDRLSSDEKEDS